MGSVSFFLIKRIINKNNKINKTTKYNV